MDVTLMLDRCLPQGKPKWDPWLALLICLCPRFTVWQAELNQTGMKTLGNSGGKCSALCVLLLLCKLGDPNPAAAGESDRVKRLFKDPPREYSTGPLWVWNDLLTEQEICDTLRNLASQKVKQVWVHPRPGLMTPYLSQDWFRLWKVALKEAERLYMNVWIYDENS